jgi:hypothetical protein
MHAQFWSDLKLKKRELRRAMCIFNRSQDLYLQLQCFAISGLHKEKGIKKLNSVALVRKRTIPTERPPHVGEVSANFCG